MLGFFDAGYTAGNLNHVFLYFLIVLVLAALVNIFSSRLLAILNNISVWWHVFGAAVVVLILVFALKKGAHHASVKSVLTGTFNGTGFFGGHTSGVGFVIYVLPLAAILTQYTITGYDASAHLSEETKSAANSAAKGIWRSIFYSAIGGWILLLSFLFAVQDKSKVGGSVQNIFHQALTSHVGGLVMLISTAGQFFCTVACMTSTTRMLFAFSRDGAVPGGQYWSKLNKNRVPVYGVIVSAVLALILTLPALVKVDYFGAPTPVAFFAVVSIGVIGLYVAFAIPIFLRWKAGANFTPGAWTLGPKYKWMCIVALVEIVITSIFAMLPTVTFGAPWYNGFAWRYVNYAILVVPGALLLLWVYWHASVKNWFKGPKTTIDLPAGVSSADEIAIEHGHPHA
jgi:amino acid transporter